jgi:superfamily II DNA or RNA helicase
MNPKLYIKNNLVLEGIDQELRSYLKSLLTTLNPEWLDAQNFGRWTKNIPKNIEQFTEDGTKFIMPRGMLAHITEDLGQVWDIVDERVAPQAEKNWPEGKVVLRYGDQEPAVRELLLHDNGFLVAPAGAGKTVMGLEIARRLGLKTLWLTHRKELKDQAIEEAVNLFDIPADKIGEFHGPKWKIGEQLTVGMIPTLRKRDLTDVADEFGCVMVDEAHHTPSSTFLHVVDKFNARFIYGLTATAYRRDKLDGVMFNAIGPKVAEIEHVDLFEDEHLMIPHIRRVKTGWNPANSHMMDYHKFMEAMMVNERRNELIVSQIVAECQDPKNTAAVLVDRTKHCEILTAMLKAQGIRAEFIVSSVDVDPKEGPDKKGEKKKKRMIPKKVREKVVNDFKNGQIQVLVATYDLLAEGFNYRPLNRLFLASPVKWKGLVVQSVGRVQRPCEGKTEAIVYDYVDENLAMFVKQADSRLYHVYREMGMPVSET